MKSSGPLQHTLQTSIDIQAPAERVWSVLTDAQLAVLFVRPDCQRRGYGGLLLRQVQQKNTTLQLAVYEENPSAKTFYERFGFRAIEKRVNTGIGHQEWVMRWEAT